jgi:hypothetical protein
VGESAFLVTFIVGFCKKSAAKRWQIATLLKEERLFNRQNASYVSEAAFYYCNMSKKLRILANSLYVLHRHCDDNNAEWSCKTYY